MTTQIIIDRDTCTMVLSDAEFTADRVRPCVDEIARRIEERLSERGIDGVEVEREYRTTGRSSRGEQSYEVMQLVEGVIVGEVDAIRAAVLSA